jgi:mono/diheme cytochrome c family protein
MRPTVVAIVTLVACAAPLPRPTDTDVLRAASQRPETTLADLERGRTLYVSRCGSCHQPYPPDRLVATAWPAQVDKMARRAQLGRDERDLISRYLVALSRRGGGR